MIVYTLGPDEEESPLEVDFIELRPDLTHLTTVSQKVVLTKQPPKSIASFCDISFPESFHQFRVAFPFVKWIYSFHGPFISYENTLRLLQKMDQNTPDLLKVCFDRISFSDYLELKPLFSLYKDRLILFAQGEECQATRILSFLWGARWIYTSKNGLYGQIPLKELLEIYQIKRLTRQTSLYGLIKGKKSPPSIGYKLYNPLFAREKIDALYLNLPVEENEVEKVLKSDLFQGFSITMPFKEIAYRLCKTLAPCATICRAVNTYVLGVGYNTDIEILKTLSLGGKRVAILGGGGVAKAFALFLKNNYEVHLFVRCKKKRDAIEGELQLKVSLLDDWQSDFDMVIDTLPVYDHGLPIQKGIRILDAKLSHNPEYEKFPLLISGKEMFLAQGKQQLKIFFKKEFVL